MQIGKAEREMARIEVAAEKFYLEHFLAYRPKRPTRTPIQEIADFAAEQVALAVERCAKLVCKHCRTFGLPDFNDGDYIGHTMPDGAILYCRSGEIRAQLSDDAGVEG